MEKDIQELQEIIKQKDRRISELENQLREHGIFVMDSEKKLSDEDKVKVFLDYFRGRSDLYAERYYNRKKQSYGWNPVCMNSFAPGCPKSQGRFNCFQCNMKSFRSLTEETLRKHFTGRNYGIGLYPLMSDHTCYLLAMDFDEDTWFEDMKSVYHQAVRHQLYPVMERSQSGSGGHLWFFFATAVKARDARRLGEYLIQEAMKSNRKLKFGSFDRMFPNQDYVPEGGAGNLIAMPLRYDAFLKGNSAFIDENEQVVRYPIEFLSSRKKITAEEMTAILSSSWNSDYFFEDDQLRLALDTDMKYVHELNGQISSCIRLEKKNMNAATLNVLCRCASMYNPKYYEMQRLHKPIYVGGGVTRVLSYYEEDDRYLYLPRGLFPVIQKAMPETLFHLDDRTQTGHSIDVSFRESLREQQKNAADTMLKNDMGILQAAPGFGKTVIAIYLIASLKVNTLILVDSKELQNQWEERIERFLEYPHAAKKKDRFICKYGSSSKKLNGNIDIAMVRSLKNAEELDKICSGYGLTIVDECHHVACDSFLHVMRHITSRYIYGLSATPKRDDGLFKVITMYCGPIRKRIGRESVREGYSFRQLLIPRYTSHYSLNQNLSYAEMCTELMQDEARNYLIVKDILEEYRAGNNIIVLTERVEHLSLLFSMLETACDDVYSLSGEVKRKERKVTLDTVRGKQKYVLLATSKLLGEGFDLPSLNCLFLVLPISSETRITQYTGRIHRTYEGKDTVKVYDYIDAQVPMAQSMYYRRLKQYEKEGYLITVNHEEQNVKQILFDKDNYEETLITDLNHAKKEAVLFVSSVNYTRLKKYHTILRQMVHRGVSVYYILNESIDPDNEIGIFLKGTGGKILIRNHNRHFVIIDGKTVWNCSFSFLGTVPKDAFATRNEDPKTAQEVILSIREKTESEEDRPKLF